MEEMDVFAERWSELRRRLMRLREEGWEVDEICTLRLRHEPNIDLTFRYARVHR